MLFLAWLMFPIWRGLRCFHFARCWCSRCWFSWYRFSWYVYLSPLVLPGSGASFLDDVVFILYAALHRLVNVDEFVLSGVFIFTVVALSCCRLGLWSQLFCVACCSFLGSMGLLVRGRLFGWLFFEEALPLNLSFLWVLGRVPFGTPSPSVFASRRCPTWLLLQTFHGGLPTLCWFFFSFIVCWTTLWMVTSGFLRALFAMVPIVDHRYF